MPRFNENKCLMMALVVFITLYTSLCQRPICNHVIGYTMEETRSKNLFL